MSDVPRVARSVDDLRVGMVVLFVDSEFIKESSVEVLREADLRGTFEPYLSSGRVLILSDAPDPPARDWLVPATQMEALREALKAPPTYIRAAARAVLDVAREVEHE